MKPGISLTLRALAHLLRYPDDEMRARLPDVRQALDADDALAPAHRQALETLMARLAADDLIAEGVYVDIFDRGRATALHLFEHIHGDSRDRGPAMVDLVKTYEAAGLLLDPNELPDHLTVLLEYASTQPRTEALAFVGEFAHILQALASALQRRDSDYVAVITALLALAGQSVQATAVAPDEPLDATWAEPPAFGGCSTQGQATPGPQPIRIVSRQRAPGAR